MKTTTPLYANSSVYRIRHYWVFLTPLKRIDQMLIRKWDMRKVFTYSVKSSSTLFYCLMRTMYNSVNWDQKLSLIFKSYLPWINTSIFTKRHCDNIFLKTSQWITWLDRKKPHVIIPPNVSDSLYVKINGTLVKKQKHLLQISVRYLHNDMILPIYQGVFC